MTLASQREIIVRPYKANELVAQIQEEVGDLEGTSDDGKDVVVQGDETEMVKAEQTSELEEKVTIDTDTRPVWEKLENKVDDLTVKVARHFADQNEQTTWKIPMVKAPPQPTKDEWERHQLTHTPFAPCCKHCNAGRAVRMSHQRADKRAKLVPDTDNSQEGARKD